MRRGPPEPERHVIDNVERLLHYELRRLRITLANCPEEERVRRILLRDRIREYERDLQRLRRQPAYHVDRVLRRLNVR